MKRRDKKRWDPQGQLVYEKDSNDMGANNIVNCEDIIELIMDINA